MWTERLASKFFFILNSPLHLSSFCTLHSAFCTYFPIACVVLLIVAAVTRGKAPAPGVPAEGQGDPAPAIAEDKPIPRDALIAMYKADLGALYKDADVDKLLQAHQLIEGFFKADSSGLRKQAIVSLQQSGVDPAAIGRLGNSETDLPLSSFDRNP